VSCSSDICDMRVMYLCRYTLSLILCHLLRLDQELKWDSEDFVFFGAHFSSYFTMNETMELLFLK
jgi:hypothetical protein